MDQFYRLSGKLVYEPARPDLKKTFKARTLIVDLPFDDLANFYRWLVKRKYGFRLDPPMWGNHITVVRGDEKLKRAELWKSHQGEVVEFEVMPHLYRVWDFWALPIRSERLYELREELGLKAAHEMHITIGRETDHDRKLWTREQVQYLAERPLFRPRAKPRAEPRYHNGRKVLTLQQQKQEQDDHKRI